MFSSMTRRMQPILVALVSLVIAAVFAVSLVAYAAVPSIGTSAPAEGVLVAGTVCRTPGGC